jgi:DNA-binding transcriptional LysR family regulator
MNDRQLRYALSVWRENSFSKAAQKLNISQPSISDQISQLESEIGFKLFARTGRGVAATHKGQRFLTEANDVIAGMLDLSDHARQLRGGPPVSFTMGIASSVARAVVPEAMAALAPLTPKVRIETITAPTRRVLRFVAEERLDAGIAIEPAAGDLPAKVIAERFGSVSITLIVPPEHALARNNAVDLARLAREPLIGHEPDIGYGQQIRGLLADRGLRPNIVAVADDAETIKLMVRAGVGLALLPRSAAEAEIESGELVALALRPKLELAMALIRADRPASGPAEKYLEALRNHLVGAKA